MAVFLTLAVIGLLVVLAALCVYKRKRDHFWTKTNVEFEPPSIVPTFFQSIIFKKPFWETDVEWCKKHRKIFGAYPAWQPALYVTDPDVLRKILVRDFQMLPDRPVFDTDDPIFRSFVSVMQGDDWKRVRSVITPAFSTGKLKKMVGLMDDCAVMTANNMIGIAENEGTTDCKRILGGFTLDIIASTAFGTKLNSANDPDNIFVQKARQFFNLKFPWRFLLAFLAPRLTKLLGIRLLSPSLMQFFVDLTETVTKKRKETGEDRGDFLQNLIEAQARGEKGESTTDQAIEDDAISDDHDAPSKECQSFLKQYSKNKTLSSDEFVASCVLFFLGGYDTIATTISMTAYYLALNPDCQQRVLEEVDEVWKNHPVVDYEALGKLKYLDATINETLRMFPPASRIERKAVCDYYIEEVDYTAPKDMIIEIPVHAIHMDPENFPNPQKYDPDRFLPENKDLIKPYTYLPFGAGPRNCLGNRFALLEIKVCLLRIFKEVRFEPCEKTKIPPELSGFFQPKEVNLRVIKRALR